MPLALVSVLGAAIFLWPFIGDGGLGTPLETAAALAVVVLLVVETATRKLDVRQLALLAALAALNALLRLLMVTGIEGFSPMFLLILCAGYVFGPSFGFLVGAYSLAVSGFATGGIGPWLPYEMFAAGWVGMVAGIVGLRTVRVRLGHVALLAAVGGGLGFVYGAIMDIWDWTLSPNAPGYGWTPGLPLGETVHHFITFYLATSVAYDGFRAVGNVVMVAILGAPILLAMERFRSRFRVVIETG